MATMHATRWPRIIEYDRAWEANRTALGIMVV
jgi:hypothetical protein